MSPSAKPLFPPRGERPYDAAAVETFPWPVTAGYEDVHRWMDEGQAVHAAWQLRDVWERLLRFLGTLVVADHLAAGAAEDPRTKKLLTQLLKKDGLTNGNWAILMEIALKDGPPAGTRLPQLGANPKKGAGSESSRCLSPFWHWQTPTALPPVSARQN